MANGIGSMDHRPYAISPQPWSPFLSLTLTFVAAGALLPLLVELRMRLAPARTAFAVAHALEDLDEPQIDLAQLHVDANHLHLHLVAKAVDLVRVLAPQEVRALDEPVVVVGHRRY